MNIRTAPVNAMTLDELIVAQAFLDLLTDRIHDNGFDVSDGIRAEQDTIKRELDDRLRGDKQRRLKTLQMQREGLMSQAEKRKKVEDEIAALEADLNPRVAVKKGGRP